MSPIAVEAVKQITGLFDIELEINRLVADDRLRRRRRSSLLLVGDLRE
jgi:hypothetical protein